MLFFLSSLFLQRENSEDILDFWLDVQQHENLCRAYFKDVRKSGRTIKEDWPQYWDYARRRGSIYGTVVGLGARDGGIGGKRSTGSSGEIPGEHAQLTTEQNEEKDRLGARSASLRSPTPGGGMNEKERQRVVSPSDTYDQPRSSTPFSLSGRASIFKRVSRAPTVIPRSAAITRMDLIALV